MHHDWLGNNINLVNFVKKNNLTDFPIFTKLLRGLNEPKKPKKFFNFYL